MHLIDWLRNWWGRSLRRRLVLLSIATTLSFLLLLGYLSFRTGQSGLRDEVNQRNRQLAVLVAGDIGAQVDNVRDNLYLLTRQLRASMDTVSLQARMMLEIRYGFPLTYGALYLFDSEGHLLIHLADSLQDLLAIGDVMEITKRAPIPVTDEISTAHEAVMRSGDPFLSAVSIAGLDEVPVVYVGMPVVIKEGQSSQIMVAEIDLRHMWRRVDQVRVGRTGRAFIVSWGGIIFAHPDRSYIGQPLSPEFEQILVGSEGQTEYTDPISGRIMLASYSPVGEGTNWSVVVEQARAEALASSRRIAITTVGVLVAALGMATITVILVGRSITLPIEHLAEVTRRITRTGNLSQQIVPGGQDEIGQLGATFNEMISSLQLAETAMKTERDRAQNYLDIVGSIILALDANGKIMLLNEQGKRILECERREAIGKNWFETFLPVRVRESVKAIFKELMAGDVESVEYVERAVVTGKGNERLIRWHNSILKDEAGKIVGTLASGEDITQRKKAEQELESYRDHLEELVEERTTELKGTMKSLEKEVAERKKAESLIKKQNERLKELDRMKSEFLSTAAHELRTPLTSILGFSEILLKRKLDEERQARFLKIINEESAGLAGLINDLLDVSRIESGRGFKIKKAPTDVKDIILENVDLFKSQTDKHTFKVNLPSDLVKIELDKDKIDQVMENLLSNAIKFSPQGGKITVSIEQADEKVKMSVTDTGIGIAKKDLTHIFEKFYRADNASSQAIGGTGLGLGIVKYIIKSHGGKIWAESKLDKGSTFSFTLPTRTSKTRGGGRVL